MSEINRIKGYLKKPYDECTPQEKDRMDAFFQPLFKKQESERTTEQNRLLKRYSTILPSEAGTQSTARTQSSIRASTINSSNFSNTSKRLLAQVMRDSQPLWEQTTTVAGSSTGKASTVVSQATTVVRNPKSVASSRASAKTGISKSQGPKTEVSKRNNNPSGFPMDEIRQLGTGSAKKTEQEFNELLDRMGWLQAELSENDIRQRYLFFNRQAKKQEEDEEK